MTVTSVQAVHTQQSPGGSPHDRIYRSLYHVYTSDYNDSPVRIYNNTSTAGDLYLPQVGDWYLWDGLEADLAAFVVRQPVITLKSVDKTRRLWNYVVTHTTESTHRTLTSRYGSPLNESWSVRLVGDEWTEEAFTDVVTGKLLGNSAQQPWTGRETEIFKSRSSWHMTKNILTLRQNIIDYTRGHVNSSTVTIKGRAYTPRTLLLRVVDAEEQSQATVGTYYAYTFKLDTNEATFDIQVPDRGTKEFVGHEVFDPGHYTDILDPYTQRPISPPGVPLDGSGNQLTAGDDPVTITQQKYPLADLNVWSFPS